MGTNRRVRTLWVVAAAVVCALTLGPGGVARAGDDAPRRTTEGIRVHGHWTIDIKNPDGSLASHYDFQNALQSSGATFLAQVLSRSRVPGSWVVLLTQSGPGPTPPCHAPLGPTCTIGEVGSTDRDVPFKTLTVTVPETGPNAGKLVFSGQATADADGGINTVATLSAPCAGTLSPASCAPPVSSGAHVVFTGRLFETTIPVLVNQIIQVTVVISFS